MLGPADVVRREETRVLFTRAAGGPSGAADAFARLESALGGPRGRRFYGWCWNGEYRACVVRQPADDPAALALEEGLLPGGAYARARHRGPFDRIHETFRALREGRLVDPTRPSLEEYRRADEVWAYLAVTTDPR